MPEAPEPTDPLSEEQIRILTLLIDGWTDDRIARELGISFSSVRRRLKEAADELGAVSRVQLAVFAVERGIVSRTGRLSAEGDHTHSAEQVSEGLDAPSEPSSTEGGNTPAT
jgi:DNA-binding CsgD family transcriptional regulator